MLRVRYIETMALEMRAAYSNRRRYPLITERGQNRSIVRSQDFRLPNSRNSHANKYPVKYIISIRQPGKITEFSGAPGGWFV